MYTTFLGSGIALAAILQLLGTIDSAYVKYNYHPPAWAPELRDTLLKIPIKIYDKDGFVKIPEGPGLGIELDEENIEKYIAED